MKQSFILRENVLTDNVLKVAPKGKIFKGGYVAILREYTFLNSWQDKEIVKRFRSVDTLQKYLEKHYSQEVVFNLDFYGTCLDN